MFSVTLCLLLLLLLLLLLWLAVVGCGCWVLAVCSCLLVVGCVLFVVCFQHITSISQTYFIFASFLPIFFHLLPVSEKRLPIFSKHKSSQAVSNKHIHWHAHQGIQ